MGCGGATESRGRAIDPLRRDERRETLARIEHARLHRVLRDAENLADLADRLLLIVDQVDDLRVLARQRGECTTDQGARIPVTELRLRVARRIDDALRGVTVERLGRPTTRGGGQRPMPRDAEQPGRYR